MKLFVYKKFGFSLVIAGSLFFISTVNLSAQSFYGFRVIPFELLNIDINIAGCGCSECECSIETIGPSFFFGNGTAISPDTILFGHDHCASPTNWGIWHIDKTTGFPTMYFQYPPGTPCMTGLVAMGGDIFYSIATTGGGDLFRIDAANGTVTNLGSTGYACEAGMTVFNGEIYYGGRSSPTNWIIVKVDVNNPANSEIVASGLYPLGGITASNICNTLIIGAAPQIPGQTYFLLNLLDGALSPICEVFPELWSLTSILEHTTPICDNYLDLDCNDSSGATEADFNSPEYDCLSNPVSIADEDISLVYDGIIEEMTIEIVGFIPDAPDEILEMTGSVPEIDVSGSGSAMIILTNEGSAKSSDFKDALRLIRYNNTSLPPTGGLRTVEVQFSTEAGLMSNIATSYIQVNELPLVPLDLGPDQEACEGETATFDAGNPGAQYDWSTGETSQIITVDQSGEYIVTVSDDINCPNQDTVELTLLPVVHVSLDGPFQTCDNEPLTLTINTDSPFPLTVEISATPGSPFVFNNVIGAFTFNDLPAQETEYTITSVTPSQPACIEITDPTQLIEVYPSYIHSFDASICIGDSIWLGFYWETEAGVYENTFNTFDGCDSVVTTNLSVLPAITISQQGTTCDSSAAGVFIEYLNNPNGCDTVIQTTITLLPSDTTYIASSSCNLANAGNFTQSLSNQEGCDSLVITSVTWIPPADTTLVNTSTCDSSQTGVFQQLLLDQTGCDSMVITTVNIGPADTTYTFGTSCDITMIGVTETLYNNQQGCDSLVITNISAGLPDTTYLNTTSCDSASLGVFEDHFVSTQGCDSTVITTIVYSASDSTFIQRVSCDPDDTGVFIDTFTNQIGCDSVVTTEVAYAISHYINLSASSCDPSDTGVYIQTLVNEFGCDSIVTETVELLPSDETFLFSTTCMSSQAGMFITTHLNQYGCDSTVTLTVSLIPADTTVLSLKTCDPAQVGNIESTFTNIDGCDSLVIEQITLYPLPELQLAITSDYSGYAISCFGESDGSVNAEVNGVPPWTYLWSTGSDDQTITGLSAGSYAVTVTDGNGCTTSGEVMLFEPEEFSISFIVTHPDCFDHQAGTITVEQIGGIEPIRYSIDEINYQSSPVFDQLSGGTYTVTAIDANDCEVKEIIWINVPLMVHVELPDDQMAFPGDTVLIQAIVNVPFDSLASVVWSGLNNPVCPTCLSQPVAPIITTTYSVTVTSLDGCMDEDAMTLFLERDDDVYMPNIFSPNGDGINDELVIYSVSDVEKILEWVIVDRWGNVVFSANNFLPNDSSISWDGKMNGKELNPGVFAYRMIVEFQDGQQNILYGDVTLIR